ncbi:ABC transporter permease [Microbispora corallina]|uniref:ABC transporter permease n=1 Tax=Microbispora corallina TaxID=83302 RepID=A0ABQ4FXI6_9ACTN|nr:MULTISPECIES: ABC transporter permease [Microbispora]ETK33734.1 ABC transporter permease [Microbispora sp. ATCC PTA-5024]GIH39536.1 ABC transporter permease [Microbispora corallina]
MLIVDVLTGGVRGGTAIMFAALGETLAERAGVVNLGTEGCMLVGALGGYAVAAETGNPWLGLLAGALAGALLGLVHAVAVVWRRADQFATGLTLMFLGLGLTSLFGAAYVGKAAPGFDPVPLPVLGDIPVIGEILFRHDPVTYLTFVAAPLLWFALNRTKAGLLVRTAGERADVLHVHGYSPGLIRTVAVTAGAALAGLGGAQLSTAYAHAWFEGMTAGRGFIAVALVIFAAWRPLWVVAGSYLFGAALAVAPALQARGQSLNQFALDALPFVITLVILAVLGRRTLRAAPEELRRVFAR